MLGNDGVKLAEWTVLQLRLPGEQPISADVLLVDPASDTLYIRLRTDLKKIDHDVALVWDELEADLIQKAYELGARSVLQWLEQRSVKYDIHE